MAVEARHPNLFSPQLIPNRENIISNPIDASIMNLYNAHMGNYSSSVLPLSGTTTTTASETLLPPAPPYNSLIADSFPLKTTTGMKSDVSTPTLNNNTNTNALPVQRKRSRDSINNYPLPSYNKNNNNNCGTFFFLGEDISLHIHHQQLHLDNLISQHMEKLRMELEEKRKSQARRLIDAIEVGMMKRLKAKEEEIDKIGKLNFALQERVKSLCIENQIWRDLAQTNEATANALRTNLEQVLAQVRDVEGGEDGGGGGANVGAALLADDAESCCGSTDEEDNGWRTLAEGAQDKEGEGPTTTKSRAVMNNGSSGGSDRKRLCKKCGKEESCVLILPCRHLCLCTVCGSTLHTCPICNSFKNASLHVNMT